MRARLTQSELQDLLEDPSEDNRARLASQIVGHIEASDLTDQERQIAKEILRVMARDAALMVREALSESVKGFEDLPRDVALELARDVESVAVPLLGDSDIFTEEDLIGLVRGGSEGKQVAIAGRKSVPSAVSEALVDTGNTDVVSELVKNEGANIPEVLMHRVVDEFGEEETVNGPLAMRSDVSATISERLVVLVTDQIRSRMIESGKIDKSRAETLVRESRERATVDLAHRLNQGQDIRKLVQQLKDNGRLTPSVILRAACSGEMRFFEEAFASLIGIEYEKAWVLAHDKGDLGFKAMFERSGLPQEIYRPCRIALDVYHELEPEFESDTDEAFSRKMMQMVLTQYEDMAGEDLEYLLGRLAENENTPTTPAPRLDAAEKIAATS